jgi:VWFA-related protein
MPSPRVAALLSLVLLAAAAPLRAQAPPRFGGTTSVVVVEVPVNVTKDGKPVRGLTAENFELTDGKTRQPITGFEVIDLGAVGAEGQRRIPIAARRHFLFLFDLTFAQANSIVRARAAAVDLVRQGFHAADLGAVATYSATRGAELVLGFTSDRSQIEAAIRSLGLPQLVNRAPDPLRLIVADIGVEADSGILPGIRGKGNSPTAQFRGEAEEARDYQMTEILGDIQRDSNELQARTEQNQVVALTRSFSELAQMMASVDGRKHVVYLSEGFAAGAAVGRGASRETSDAVAEGEWWKSESETVYGSSRVQSDVERMLEAFRRADCVVQAVDIGGVRTVGAEAQTQLASDAQGRNDGRDVLLTMARDTGGELFQNTNDLSAAMARMLSATSVTYLLAFQPEVAQDGTFHPVKVRLKGGPRGARVSHRAGYYAPDPLRVARPLEHSLTSAAAILSGKEGGNLPVSALAAPLPGAAGKAVVPLLVEVDGPALLAGHVGPAMTVEIYAYALGTEGSVDGFLTQRLELDLTKVADELRASGLKFYGELELPAGSYEVRLLVKNAQMGGASALRSLPVEVPAAPQLSPPLFVAAGGGWLLARQAPRPGEAPREYPFTLAGQPFVPDARPVVAAAGEARIALLAYDLGSGEVVARAEVLRAADRQPAAGGGFRLLERQRGEAGAPDRLVGVFTPAGLPPGEYVLRVTVTDQASGAARSSAAPFVVEG